MAERTVKRVLVCQHVPYEPLGTFHPMLKAAGVRMRYCNFGRHPDLEPRLDGYDGVVLLGGPMSADQDDEHPHLATEARLVEDAMKRDIPVLGICLGAQIIARALGARLFRNPVPEIGWYRVSPTNEGADDPLIGKFATPEERVFQWHTDTFDLPTGAVHLASADACDAQAYRFGENVYGFQFHLEVDRALIERWLTVDGHVRQLEGLRGIIDAEQIREQTPEYVDRLADVSRRTFSGFLDLLGHRKRVRVLSSR